MDKEKRNAAARARYRARKAEITQEAIAWQLTLYNPEREDYALLHDEMAYEYFRYLGKRYGLIREFRENAII